MQSLLFTNQHNIKILSFFISKSNSKKETECAHFVLRRSNCDCVHYVWAKVIDCDGGWWEKVQEDAICGKYSQYLYYIPKICCKKETCLSTNTIA